VVATSALKTFGAGDRAVAVDAGKGFRPVPDSLAAWH
jgi:hypothetical protein